MTLDDSAARYEVRATARQLAQEFVTQHEAGAGWRDELFRLAAVDAEVLPWASLSPNPLLIDWLTAYLHPPVNSRALVLGCGVGDDSEELADWGFTVTAVDGSKESVDWCRDRFIGSAVTYKHADLLDPPPAFSQAFEFVYDSSTLASLPRSRLRAALASLAGFVAPGGILFLIAPAPDPDDPLNDASPCSLTKRDLEVLQLENHLEGVSIEEFSGAEESPPRRFRAVFRRR